MVKKDACLDGACYLDSDARRRWALGQMAVDGVWGAGWQYATKRHELDTAPRRWPPVSTAR